MFSKSTSAVLIGTEPRELSVEARVTGGKRSFSLVGLPDTAIREARDRVTAAVGQSGFRVPSSVTVNLAPADLPKSGSGFDLAIALAVLVAARRIPPGAARVVAAGELALDGSIRSTNSGLAAALVARRLGRPCLLPPEAAETASYVEGVDVRPVRDLCEAIDVALGRIPAEAPEPVRVGAVSGPDLADVRGQAVARRALEVAAAGGHHIMFSGPPGCGKTMLARRLPSILPPLDASEALEVACVWAAGDRWRPPGSPPPFRSPHHSASMAAVLGGGSGIPVPGELSLAHRGVLFLDELGEYPANLLDALRQPMEQGSVTIARKGATGTYPAACQIVAATNPCPCGYEGDRLKECGCSEAAIAKYRNRLSGPLLDRFDLRVDVQRPERLDGEPGESSAAVRARVAAARAVQAERGTLNRDLEGSGLDSLATAPAVRSALRTAVDRGVLTGRGYDRVRRVARTLADLAGVETVGEEHLGEAMSLRGRS